MSEDFDLFAEQSSSYNELAEAESFYAMEGSDAAIYTGSKNKWVYSYPSYIGKRLEIWKRSAALLKEHFTSTSWTRGSHFMSLFLNDPALLQQVEIGMFDSILFTDHNEIAPIDEIVDYAHKLLGQKIGNKAFANTPLAAGKSTQYQINYGNVFPPTTFDMSTGKPIVDDMTLEIFFDYFMAEYNRMIEAKTTSRKTLNYNTGDIQNAFKFWVFPEFNDNALIDLFDENNDPLDKDGLTSKQENEIRDHIRNILADRIMQKAEYFKEQDLLSMLDLRIVKQFKNNVLEQISGQLVIQSLISNIEYSMMFSGDPAFYKGNLDYKKRVPGSYSDGLHMSRLRDENGKIISKFNVAVVDSVYADPDFSDLEGVLPKKIIDSYKRTNATDAQAWITPKRWKQIMQGLGKWSPAREEVYKKMIDTKTKHTFSPAELKMVAQPLKGVYFSYQNGLPVYLKYSQAVLLPNFIKGTDLEKLYDKMNSQNIDEVVAADGIKVGSPVPTKIDDNGKLITDFDLSNSQLTLDNAYWKLQQDLPTKGVNERMIGSQIQKIIFQGLVYNRETIFDLDDGMTGDAVIEHINEIYNEMIDTATVEMRKELNIDDNNTISNEAVFYRAMIHQLRLRGDVPENVISALESGVSPYAMPGYNEVFQNTFSAYYNKKVIRLTAPGAGYIQMADFGITSADMARQKIIYTPWMHYK